MTILERINPVARAILVIGAVMGLVSGITFAALQSQATLTNNTISSDTADLVVNNEQDNEFNDSEEGFAFENVNPGEGPSEAKNFQLRNQGDVALDTYVQVTGESALPAGVSGDDITFVFTPDDNSGVCGTGLTADWATITTAKQLLIDDFAANPVASCDFSVTVEISDDVMAESVNIPAFNFTFTGVADTELEA